MAKRRCVLVFNPNAGRNSMGKDEIIARLSEEITDLEIDTVETTGNDDTAQIKAKLAELRPEFVVVAGGDGTVKQAACSVIGSSVPLGIIPLGSANGLATCLGVQKVDSAIEAIKSGKFIQMDAVSINGQLSFHLADLGFNANMIKKFEEGESRGMLAYVKSSLSEVFATESTRYDLKIGENTFHLNSKMLVIANGNKYGTGAVINSKGKIDDGFFEIISLDPKSVEDYIKMSFAFFAGKLEEIDGIQSWSCDSCILYNPSKSRMQIDGELSGEPEEIAIHIQKGILPIFVGTDAPSLFEKDKTS